MTESGAAAAPGAAPAAVERAAADKRALRVHFRALRRASLPGAQERLRAVALERLAERLPAGRSLGLYWPVAGEPDLALLAPGGLADRLAGRLALPAVLPEPGAPGRPDRLVYLFWDGAHPSGRDACGIPAPLAWDGRPPAALSPETLGLLLVPALALDRRGVRLGSGGGWYDRLRADPAWRAVPALAVLPSACVVDRLPRDSWDVSFQGWLDEHGLHDAEAAPDA